MPATTAISLCSQATLLLGEDTIEDFETGIGATCGALYDTNVEGWLANYPWSFCKVKAKLSRLTATPTNKWQYIFQLPTDKLSPDYAVYDSDAVGAVPTRDFEIMTDKLLSNRTDIWIDYLARPAESKWPPYFKIFAINALAAVLALPLTQDKSLKDDYGLIAFGPPSDNLRGGLYGMAMLTDSQAQPSQIIIESPLVDARLA